MATGFDFADVVDEAVERSGGQEATASDVAKIRRGLRILTERWMAQGYNTWRICQTTVLATGVATPIQLDECVDDIIQVMVKTSTGDTTEKSLTRISPTQYAQLTRKFTLGEPSQYYLDRKETPQLFLYPVGETTFTHEVNVYYVERPAEYDRFIGDAEDVPGRWLEALISGLALDLARKRPPYNEPLIQRLKLEYAEAEDLAQRADRGRQRYRYRTSYMR